MPRFVVLEHRTDAGVHFDLMLESGDVLRTWSLSAVPTAGAEVPARPLADHRAAYLEYEGPISGGRGEVRRWDVGTFRFELDNAAEVRLAVSGRRLQGRLTIRGTDNLFGLRFDPSDC